MKSLQSSSPIIVVGPGRSGTSVTAKILHEKLGVFMGERFRFDKDGVCYYEDLDFRNLNRHFLDNNLVFGEWMMGAERLISKRESENHLWGFKDPRGSYIIGLYLMFFDSPRFIRCRRDINAIVESMSTNYNWPADKAEQLTKERELVLDRCLRGKEVLELDFDNRILEEDLEKKLKHFLNGG